MHKTFVKYMFLCSVQYVNRQGDNMTYKNNMRCTYDTLNDMNLCMIYFSHMNNI